MSQDKEYINLMSSYFNTNHKSMIIKQKDVVKLLESIKKNSNHIIFIPSTEWNPKGFKDSRNLYLEDHIHLNNRGYYLLDSCIATHISHDYITTRDSL